MTKVKEKMMQWSRYLEILKKIDKAFISLTGILLIILVILLIKRPKDIICAIIYLIATILAIGSVMIGICSSTIECFKDKSIEFVQKNNFWNIILSSTSFIIHSECMIMLVTGFTLYCTLRWSPTITIIFMLVFIIFANRRITGFFEKRLKE